MNKRDNSGALFKNDKKESDNHPDYKGSAMIDGTEYWVSSWINESKNGQKYMSLKYTIKEDRKQEVSDIKQSINDFEDDVPF
jgi:uncharacterized protein (DUF736 family)